MSTNNVQNSNNQEIDLANVFKSIGRFFGDVLTAIFKFIFFLKQKWIIVLALLLAGIAAGYYIDGPKKDFSHEIIVKPNFESVDYLYSKIELLNTKIKKKDYAYLGNELGFKNPEDLVAITVEPLTDVYLLVNNSKDNFDLLKLLAEDGDIKNVISDKVTSKYYPNHHVLIQTKGETTAEMTFEPLMKFLNDSDYYQALQNVYVKNIEAKIALNDRTIAQIDSILLSLTATAKNAKDKSMYISENSQLADIIQRKEDLSNDSDYRKVKLLDTKSVIREVETIANIQTHKTVFERMKFVLPLVFVLIFCIVYGLRKVYVQQEAKIKAGA